MEITVQFTDSTEAVIDGVFCCPQPADLVPYQGIVSASDPRYAAWWERIIPGTITTGLPTPSA